MNCVMWIGLARCARVFVLTVLYDGASCACHVTLYTVCCNSVVVSKRVLVLSKIWSLLRTVRQRINLP